MDKEDYSVEEFQEDLEKQLRENVLMETINDNAWARFWREYNDGTS